MSRPHPVQVIAVTGGKGGVGKSNVSVNLGIALSQMGRRVVLLDADLGLANIDVLLGITASRNLSDVLAGECDLRDVLVNGPGGVKIVPASSGTQRPAATRPPCSSSGPPACRPRSSPSPRTRSSSPGRSTTR